MNLKESCSSSRNACPSSSDALIGSHCTQPNYGSFPSQARPVSALEPIADPSTLRQLRFFLQMVLPSIASAAIACLLQFVNLMFLGKANDKLLLGACGFGNCWTFVMVISVVNGLGTAIDTFCSQAFGARDYLGLGRAFNRGTVLVNLAAIPMLVVSWEVGPVLRFLGYSPRLADYVCEYVRWQMPAVILEIEFGQLVRFFSAQRVFKPQLYINLCAALFHAVACYIAVVVLDLRIRGAALALDCTALLHVSLAYSYIRFSGRFTQTWVPLDREAFSGWGEFVRVAIPNALMVIPLYLGLFLLGLEAGYLRPADMAAHSIMNSLTSFLFSVTKGYNTCAGTLAGNTLGEGRTDLVRKLPAAALKCYYISFSIIGVLAMVFRSRVVYLFTHDAEVHELACRLLPLVVVTQLTNSFQAIFGGILRGVGKTVSASIGNIVVYALILHPLALGLAFWMRMGVFGLWIGWLVGTSCSGILFALIWWRLDLERTAKEIHERRWQRMQIDNKPTKELASKV